MRTFITLELVHQGPHNQKPSKRSLRTIEDTLRNAIDNHDLDLTLAGDVQLVDYSIKAMDTNPIGRGMNMVIHVEGGLVQAIYADKLPVEGIEDITVLDLDNDRDDAEQREARAQLEEVEKNWKNLQF